MGDKKLLEDLKEKKRESDQAQADAEEDYRKETERANKGLDLQVQRIVRYGGVRNDDEVILSEELRRAEEVFQRQYVDKPPKYFEEQKDREALVEVGLENDVESGHEQIRDTGDEQTSGEQLPTSANIGQKHEEN